MNYLPPDQSRWPLLPESASGGLEVPDSKHQAREPFPGLCDLIQKTRKTLSHFLPFSASLFFSFGQ